jgi:hypothetical protein
VVALLGSTPVAGAIKGLVLPAGSVGTAQLRANAVTSAKIRNGAITAIDVQKGAITAAHVKDGSLLAADFRAGQLPAGPKDDPGATNVVYRRHETTLSPAGLAVSVAQCTADERLTGGGAALLRAGDTLSNDPSVALVASYPATNAGPPPGEGAAASRWVAVARAAEPSSTRDVAFAACAKP